MPSIHAIKAFEDNYIWVISQDNQAIIVDAGEAEPVLDYLNEHQLTPIAMLITHHHDDHTGGVADIKAAYPAMQIIAHCLHGVQTDSCVDEGDDFALMGLDFKVWRTAGHTDTHLSYLCDFDGRTHVFCGDTLFSGGCGRVFTGTIDELYQSFQLFDKLDDEFSLSDNTIYFYPAHEYTLSNLKFAQFLEPNNADIAICIEKDTQLRANNLPTLPTTLQMERQINPFLRALNPNDELFENTLKNGFKGDKNDRLALFAFLRELKNTF